MLMIAIIIGLFYGMLLLRKQTLSQASTEAIGPASKKVQAYVDGKPVHSYVADE